MILTPGLIISQAESNYLPISFPCQESQEPYFAGGSTLCELNSNFSPDYTIADGTLASDLNLTLWPVSSSDFNNKKILVQGIFYLDISVALKDCIVKLAPGAQIVVGNPGAIFPVSTEILSFRTKYFSCETMWKGIVIMDGNKARFYNSTFEDAQYAVTVGSNVNLAFYGNTFNRNFVGITNDKFATTMPMQLFKRNTFDCTSALHDFYDLELSDQIDPVTYAGFLLKGCASSIGYFDTENKFRNLAYGIIAKDAKLNVKGCEFSDAQLGIIIPKLLESFPAQSCGIHTIGGELFITGDDENVSATFLSEGGIITSGTDCFISYAEFYDASISCGDNNAGQTIFIEDNDFSSTTRFGSISVSRSMASGDAYHTIISRNTIIHGGLSDYNWAIYVNGKNDAKDYALVSDNIIAFDQPQTNGISVFPQRSDNLRVEDNVIDFADELSSGIYLWLGQTQGTNVSFNEITGFSYTGNPGTSGILAQTVRGPKYCANTTSLLKYGLKFEGNCDNSHITQNYLGIDEDNALGTGLYVEDYNSGLPGLIGVQTGTRNLFLEPGSIYQDDLAARFESSADIEMSLYVITEDDALLPVYNPNPNFIDPPSGWFRTQGEENYLCNDGSILFVTPYDSLMINSDSTFEQLPVPVKFYQEKTLINLLLADTGLKVEYEDYLTNKAGTSEFVLAMIEHDMKEAFQMELSAQENLDSLLSLIQSEFEGLLSYDDTNYSNVDTVTFAFGIHQDSILAILERIYNMAAQRSDIREDRLDDLVTALVEIEDSLEAFTPVAQYDDYYRSIYLLRIKEISEGNLDSLDYVLLNEIVQDDTDSSFANIVAYATFDLCRNSQISRFKSNKGTIEPALSHYFEQALQNNQSEKENDIKQVGPNDRVFIYDISGRLVAVSKGLGSVISNYYYRDLAPGVYYRIIVDPYGRIISSGLFPIVRS